MFDTVFHPPINNKKKSTDMLNLSKTSILSCFFQCKIICKLNPKTLINQFTAICVGGGVMWLVICVKKECIQISLPGTCF